MDAWRKPRSPCPIPCRMQTHPEGVHSAPTSTAPSRGLGFDQCFGSGGICLNGDERPERFSSLMRAPDKGKPRSLELLDLGKFCSLAALGSLLKLCQCEVVVLSMQHSQPGCC